ncbi:uncharacterized protein LOC120279447 [Dioscorea cayenensis subsp. rotundata]|uniref:Uncharacterized protein LOC120279447 n=1 Tax=Dioscorea cayennensis subsp. rotundata TaxID=55577 RepID=A0AB40CR16_DIOCR|nr:uncharacterized protein LOC120279447 [Dioscorea cayenensis subsp. rotundata]
MSQKYGADESCHPEFDPQLWCDAIGGMETTRTHVYGFGTTPRGKSFLSPTNSIGEACSTACSPQVDQTPHSNTEVDNLREEVTVVKNKLQSLEDSQKNIVQSQNEIKAFLSQITEMLNPTTIARNAGFSQFGTSDRGQEEDTTDDEV